MTHPNATALAVTIKQKAEELRELLARIDDCISEQHQHATATEDVEEMERLASAEPFKWLDAAKASMQMGVMHALRAVEQPTGF